MKNPANKPDNNSYMKNYSFLDDKPCNTCDEVCDGWEAQYCCKLCHYYYDDPDCEDCDPWEI